MNELHSISKAIAMVFCLVVLLTSATLVMYNRPDLFETSNDSLTTAAEPKLWEAPDTTTIPTDEQGRMIRYGRDLIVRTSRYLGPHGSVKNVSNGMNCQNCHLEAGTKPFGNNYGSVASLYPKFRPRSAMKESIERRVNDCFERSLNGQAIDSSSREMQAIVSYIRWVGKDVPPGRLAPGAGFAELEWLPRAADPAKGRKGYLQKCQVCHGATGEGQRLIADGPYIYPPLWGENSFTTGAGLFRISNFARYIRTNMPNGATYQKPMLTVEESWDIAAYVESLPRPVKTFSQDWPKVELKPVDHPFGPYADTFSEQQHKYGPFKEIIAATKK
jgi:thiosulfate dehydrogenase